MSNPFLGEIRIVGFNFAPQGWALCDGQLLSINQNQGLFALLGAQFGGDGASTFALPNLQGRFAIHQGSSFVIGGSGGAATVTMTTAQLPAHTHTVRASQSAASAAEPGGNYLAGVPFPDRQAVYSNTGPGVPMAPGMVESVGHGQPIGILPPYLTLNFIIALTGIFPTRD
jgi:microcystin-dependent protein